MGFTPGTPVSSHLPKHKLHYTITTITEEKCRLTDANVKLKVGNSSQSGTIHQEGLFLWPSTTQTSSLRRMSRYTWTWSDFLLCSVAPERSPHWSSPFDGLVMRTGCCDGGVGVNVALRLPAHTHFKHLCLTQLNWFSLIIKEAGSNCVRVKSF